MVPSAAKRRVAILWLSYASLAAIAVLAWATMQVHVGAIAVIPLLFIAYYVRPAAAVVTAFVSGITLALLDLNMIFPARRPLDVPPVLDVLILTAALCAIVVVANRLHDRDTANEVLRGRLVTARREAERDALTGLLNRAAFLRILEDSMQRRGSASHIALLFCDLDGFKLVNDSHGHLAGDRLLRMVAARLNNSVRTIDTVARMGGDEFAILVEQTHHPAEAMRMASNIERAFKDPFHSDDERYRIGVTIGVSHYPEDAADADSLLRVADKRMYIAKRAKHGRVS